MKIRFGRNDIIDTKKIPQEEPEQNQEPAEDQEAS
jgi:hypothetical protein